MAVAYRTLPAQTEKQIAKFWRKVRKGGPDECWEWLGCCGRKGYGVVRRFSPETNRWEDLIASRVAYGLATGTDPGPLFVCHTCDNPPCCNPAHLYAGTPKDNLHDASVRGRLMSGERSIAARFPGIRRGEKNGRAKLDADGVRAVRALLLTGLSQEKIAAQFGVRQHAVSAILTGKTWKHVI